jgi:hypothetical protein
MNSSRRSFLHGTVTKGAALSLAASTLRQGYGRPLKGNLRLRITNPDAPTVDPQVRGCEFPPNVVTAGGRRFVFMSGGMSYVYEVAPGMHILREPQRITASERVFSIGGFDVETRDGIRNLTTEYRREDFYWKKTYCGTFNVDLMPADPSHGEWVFSINHNENKNARFRFPFGTFFVHNSVNLNDPSGPETSSGSTPGVGYRDYQPAYFGFVSMSYAPLTAETRYGMILNKHDMGPVLWPWTGFLTPDGKAKSPRHQNPHPHPSSLIAEDPKDGKKYIYVFQIESSTNPDAAERMIMAARSPIESRAMPGSFLNLFKGEYTEPSLPANMKEDIAVLLTRPGGRCDPIHPSLDGRQDRINRFFAARLKRSGLFLSIESYSGGEGENRYMESALRLSEDLRAWTDRFVLPNSRVRYRQPRGDTPPFGLHYPKFLSADGSSHYEIDESQPFYIIATKPMALIHRELSIEIG